MDRTCWVKNGLSSVIANKISCNSITIEVESCCVADPYLNRDVRLKYLKFSLGTYKTFRFSGFTERQKLNL